jgi:hypothetical protein
MFLCVTSKLRAQTVTVGDPSNPAALPQAILDAHAAGATDITIAPGTYDLPSRNQQETLVFDGWKDTTIHATGATLIFEELFHHPLLFRKCSNVTWEGGTLRYAKPAYTQGRVIAMGTDEKGPYCDWRIDAGYPTKLQDKSLFNIVDQNTRRLKVGTGDWYPPDARAPSADGSFRLRYPADRFPGFAINDWLVTRAVGGNMVVVHEMCGACTMKDVTLQNAGFAAFFETNGAGGNRYLGCTVEPAPRPDGATEDELVGGGADGFHSNATEIGPDIEDCTWRGVFLDDCIAIHGMLQQVWQVDGNRLQTESRNFHPKAGDPLRIASMHGFFAQGTITDVGANDGRSVWLTLDQNLNVPIDPSGGADKRKGTQVSDPTECGAGYKILRCHLGDTRSRGILVKADNGIIDSCTIEGTGMSGVSIGPEFWWGEAGYCWHVVVSNNTFVGCGQINRGQSTVFIHGDGAIGNRDIAIRNNTFTGCYGPVIVGGFSTDGLEISGNHFDQSFPIKSDGTGHEIYLSHCRNVKLLDNKVTAEGPSAGILVQPDATVKASDIQNDNSTGIAVSDSAGPASR